MNIRKAIDYSAMFAALDTLMAADPPQMKLYCEIGRLVSGRPEKGAAVAASEYLCGMYPDASGFSPRNLRRMRGFYRTYESSPEVLAQAMTIGWTQNVVILEAELTPQERAWYIQAVQWFEWSKLELQRKIAVERIWKSLSTSPMECAILRKRTALWSVPPMTKIPFICHGNICRSPMAGFVMKGLVKKAGLETEFLIASAATSTEAIGNPVYPPARRKLADHGISYAGKTSRQLTGADYDQYDLLIGMDRANIRNVNRVCGGDSAGKLHLLMEYAGRPDSEVADPWYTDDFETTWRDVLEGCRELLASIVNQ